MPTDIIIFFINSSTSAPLNATIIAVMKVSDVEVVRVGIIIFEF